MYNKKGNKDKAMDKPEKQLPKWRRISIVCHLVCTLHVKIKNIILHYKMRYYTAKMLTT